MKATSRLATVADEPDIVWEKAVLDRFMTDNTNPAGIIPTEFKVLIEPKPVEEKRGSIIIPDSTKESEKYAQIEGRIIACSHLAFSYATADEWAGNKPKPGDLVLYAKYAGVRVKGKDGKEYVLANDKDITALLAE